MAATTSQKQVNLRLDDPLYGTLEALARQERRTVPQTARMLLQEGLRWRTSHTVADGISALEIAEMAERSGAFDWLADEPDLYDDACGEPIQAVHPAQPARVCWCSGRGKPRPNARRNHAELTG